MYIQWNVKRPSVWLVHFMYRIMSDLMVCHLEKVWSYMTLDVLTRPGVINTCTARPVCWRVSGSFDSYCSLKPLCSGMGEVVPARTSPTLLPPSPRTVLSLSCFKVLQCINCRDWHFKSYTTQIQTQTLKHEPNSLVIMILGIRKKYHNMFGSSTTWDRSTTHPKFDPTGIRTHDLQIMTVHFMSLGCRLSNYPVQISNAL